MGDLRRRLKKLEGGLPKGPCPECGEYATNDPSVVHAIELEWIMDENDPRYHEEPTICPACGEPDFRVVRWLDLEPEQ